MRSPSMRARSLVVLVTLIAVSCSSGHPSTWTWTTSPARSSPSVEVSPSPTQNEGPRLLLLGVQFLTKTEGFLIRCHETRRGWSKELDVAHDGGRRWRTVGRADGY